MAQESTPEEKIAELQKQLEESNEINFLLQEKIDELEAAPSGKKEEIKTVLPTKPFKVGNDEYVFTVPKFTNPLEGHSVITAEEALTNEKLLKYLVANDCGVTKKVK